MGVGKGTSSRLEGRRTSCGEFGDLSMSSPGTPVSSNVALFSVDGRAGFSFFPQSIFRFLSFS